MYIKTQQFIKEGICKITSHLTPDNKFQIIRFPVKVTKHMAHIERISIKSKNQPRMYLRTTNCRVKQLLKGTPK